MQKISRIHLANCGFRTAWYEAVTFNLTEQGTGLPTDTIINLENGGGKTTLLGLVFSCFETSQERFLKHIQSKHNSFSQYFTHDGVPGFIIIEWLMPPRTAGGQPYKLVTGQAVSVRTTTETDVDRMFFSFEERADLRLEDVPAPDLSGAQVTSMNDFSRWIHDQQKKHADVFISHNRQAEWQRHLKDERLIDLDMLRMQVNFSAQEGGFDTGFLDFKTESEFLRKFLFLTSDTTKAEEARRSVVSVCELHRRKPQLQRRRDQLKKFRISLTTFTDAARQYMEAVGTQRTMLISGALHVQALQARAADHRKAQAAALTFETEQRTQMGAAVKDAALFLTDWITGTWVWHQKRVAQAKKRKDDADTLVSGLETQSKLLKAARLQQEIAGIDVRIKELDALAEAEMAELKPAKDHVEIQGALLRRALFTEEGRLKDELTALDSRSKLREERKTTLRSQKLKADADELRLTREQTGLQTAESQRDARRLVLEREAVFVGTDESVDEAIARHEAAASSSERERELQRAARDSARTQAGQHRTEANGERVKAAGLDEQAKALRTYIARGEAELERLGQLPALLSAVETDRVDPQSPALLPRLQDVITDSNRQKSLADVRLAELRATRQAIEDTGVAGFSHDVALVVQALHAAGVRSAMPFNEYIARAVDDAAKAQALVLSDPARYSGVCVAHAEFAKAAGVSWHARKPSRPVMVSIAALDTVAAPDDRVVVPPEDASAFNIAAATRLAESLDSRLREEEQRRAAYELRHAQTLKAAQELETFATTYGNGQLAEAAVKRATLEEDASAARTRASTLEAEAVLLEAKAQQHDTDATEHERMRSDSAQAVRVVRQFQAEHEVGREDRLVRLAELGQELTEAGETKAEVDLALEELQEAHDADQTKRANTDVELRMIGDERGRIAYYNREYPAQEQLQQHPCPLTTLRDLYEDARANYQTEEKARLGSLSERIQGVKEQRAGKTKEFTRDFSGVNMADLKPYLSLDHEAELRTTDEQLGAARKEQVEASGQHQSLGGESRKWHASNKQNIGTATSEFEWHAADELEPILESLKKQIDAANDRLREASTEANRAADRAREKLRAAESDEQNESILRSGMGLPDHPDPALIAAEIGALIGEAPVVPDPTSIVLELNSGKQVSSLLAEYNGKNAGVAKLQTAARGSFDALKNAAGDATFREADPDVAVQMMQNDFTAACTDAPRLLEHLDDRISTTESTLTGMQADFDTCVEEVLGVVRGAITTLNKACGPEKCVPASAPYVGGKQVLKMRANFSTVTLDMRRAAMRNYLDVLADTLAIPAKGTDLIADAVARVYGKPLGLHVLKMSVEESEQYVPVEKISNSGGEGVVMAMFLYLVINQLRAENHAQVQKNAGGPLILDNPFAKATTAVLWRSALAGIRDERAAHLRHGHAGLQRHWRVPALYPPAQGRPKHEDEAVPLGSGKSAAERSRRRGGRVTEFLKLLQAGTRKRVPLAELRQHYFSLYPDVQNSPDRGARLLEALRQLEAAGALSLPAAGSWEKVGIPPLPQWILLARETRPAPTKDLRAVTWAPELGFWPELRPGQLETLVPLNEFLLRRRSRLLVVPIKERSLEIFGDEKCLDAMCTGDSLFAGRLQLSTLGCFRVPQPLPYRLAEAPGRPVLVVENHNSFWSFGEWNHEARRYAAVVYGSGEAFRLTGRALLQVLREVDGVGAEYLGDLDPKGVRIPGDFNRAAEPGSPQVRPAVPFYQWLLAHGVRRNRPECAAFDAVRSEGWLGADLAAQVTRLWQTEHWIPQEALGFEQLSTGVL